MKKQPPDLVFDEPIATGWLRTEFYGDQAKASVLIPTARMQLGFMRTMYGVNTRIAEGESGGFYHGKYTLPDGSMIQTITNDGHDTLRIWAAPDSDEATPKRKESIRLLELRACGTVFNDDGGRFAVLWFSPDDGIVLAALDGGSTTTAYDISDDGSTVVGTCRSSAGSIRAVRWDVAGNVTDLGSLVTDPESYSETYATGVSADGNVIVGYGTTDNGDHGWYWTADTGMVALPDMESPGVPTVTNRFVVSPSGEYVAGMIDIPTESPSENRAGAAWRLERIVDEDGEFLEMNAYGPTVMSQPTTTSQQPDGGGGILTTVGDYALPQNIDDAGLVTGHTSHRGYVTDNQTVTSYYNTGGSFISGSTGYQQDRNTLSDVFTWDSISNVYQVAKTPGACAAAADEIGAFAGTNVTSEFVSVTDSFQFPPQSDFFYEVRRDTTYGQWQNTVYQGWVFDPTDSAGQVSLGANTKAYDISENGIAVVGASSNEFGSDVLPMLWMQAPPEEPDSELAMPSDLTIDLVPKAWQAIELAMPSGMTRGRATAVAYVSVVDGRA